jgi:hypothetical protein
MCGWYLRSCAYVLILYLFMMSSYILLFYDKEERNSDPFTSLPVLDDDASMRKENGSPITKTPSTQATSRQVPPPQSHLPLGHQSQIRLLYLRPPPHVGLSPLGLRSLHVV